jgi:serine protease Do
LGLEISELDPGTIAQYHLNKQEQGVVITKINPGSVAAGVGLKEGDVVVKINREDVKSVADFEARISKINTGDDILFYIHRGMTNLFIAFAKPAN